MERILEDVERLCCDKELFPIIDKVSKGERLTFEDGMTVMNTPDLNSVGMLADYVKRKSAGDKVQIFAPYRADSAPSALPRNRRTLTSCRTSRYWLSLTTT